jgi:hypothetical protein
MVATMFELEIVVKMSWWSLNKNKWFKSYHQVSPKGEPFGELGAITGTQCWLLGIKD